MAAEPLLERGTAGWRFHDAPQHSDPAMESGQWRAATYDDQQWQVGRAILGYGDADIATELSYGDHPQQKRPAAFFRRRFRVANISRFRLLRGRICCDDGAVVWINGREVYRHNMPTGNVSSQTFAVRAIGPSAEVERRYHGFEVATDAMVEGENVVAVSVHQATPTSSDLAMDFELAGLTTDEEVQAFRIELDAQRQHETTASEASVKISPVVHLEVSAD
jgi:hypothetical protein